MWFKVAIAWALLTGPAVALLLEARHAAWVAMLGYHAGCAGVAAGLRAPWGARPGVAALVAWSAISAGVVFGTGWLAVPVLLEEPALERAGAVLGTWGMDAAHWPWILLYYVLVNPGVEEWFWRCAILTAPGRTEARWRRTIAIFAFVPFHGVVLAAVFGSAGLPWMLFAVTAASAFWTWLQIRGRSTWLSYASHFGADVGVGLLYVWFLSP